MSQNIPDGQPDAPQQPAAPQYQQPPAQPAPPAAPQYQQPPAQPAAPQYQQPAAPQYQAPMNQYQQPAAPMYTAAPQYGYNNGPADPKGMAIAAMVLGIASLVFFWTWFLGIPVAIVGLVLGIVSLRKENARGMALTGVICSGIALLASVIFVVFVLFWFSAASSSFWYYFN